MMFQGFDQTTKKLLLLFLSLLLCWWLFFASATCSASGTQMYQITEQELATLESNLSQLSSINTKLQLESSKQLEQVAQLQNQVEQLKSQLAQLQEASQKQESSLTNANKLLEQYAIEEKRTRLRIKAQRNFWEAVAACLVVGLIVK